MTGIDAGASAITIAILSRHSLVCLGLQTLFERAETLKIVARPHQRMTPDLLLPENRPDLFIIDLETERDALGTITQIRESAPNSKIVLLSGVEDSDRLAEACALGVDGVVLNLQSLGVMLATIEALYALPPHRAQVTGNAVGVASLMRTSTQQVESEMQRPAWSDVVTERERTVIQLVRQGLSNKEIADRLCIADSTVRHHLTSIFDKVGVTNRQKLLIHTHQFRSAQV